MKVWLVVLVGLGALLLGGVLAAILRSRSAQQADTAFHRDLSRTLELGSPAFENEGPLPAALSSSDPSFQWTRSRCK